MSFCQVLGETGVDNLGQKAGLGLTGRDLGIRFVISGGKGACGDCQSQFNYNSLIFVMSL